MHANAGPYALFWGDYRVAVKIGQVAFFHRGDYLVANGLTCIRNNVSHLCDQKTARLKIASGWLA